MKRLIPLLLLPLSVFAEIKGPGCADLSGYLQQYEMQLHSKTIQGCPGVDHNTIIGSVPSIVDKNFLANGKVCMDFTAIETQLQNARLQLAVLNGIDKLKTTLSTAQEDVKNKKVTQVAALTFVDTLNTAQSLEVLLEAQTKDKSFMVALRDAPANPGFSEQMDLMRRIQAVCKDLPKEHICDPKQKIFTPSPDAAKEIMKLVNLPKAPTEKDVLEWKNKLKIQRKAPKDGDATYTFTQMRTDLENTVGKLDNKQTLTPQEVKAIESLDQFKDFDGPSVVADLNLIKNSKQSRLASDKVQFLLGDSKLRQQYEVQSMLSITWNFVKDKFPGLSAEEIATCDQGKSLYPQAAACVGILKAKQKNVTSSLEQGKLANAIPSLETSVSYANLLQEKETKCSGDIKQNDLASAECLSFVNNDKSKLQDQINQLNILKEKILFENQEMIKWRNFALQQFRDPKSGCSVVASNLEFCADDSIITKDAALTISNNMQIAVMLSTTDEAKTKAIEDIKPLCEDEDAIETNRMKKQLCSYFADSSSEEKPKDNPKVVKTRPITPEDDGHEARERRDVILQGTANILGSTIRALYPPQQNMGNLISPYPYNMTPYNSGRPPLGIADGIMFNARTYGAYGFYASTPGYTPGSTMPLGGISAYKPMAPSASKYFSY